MARLSSVLRELKAQLKEIPKLQTVTLWNNQIQHKADGQTYLYAVPAAFIEVVPNASYATIGEGFKNADIAFRIHLESVFYDAQDGSMDENFEVFDYRDLIQDKLEGLKLDGLSILVMNTEAQDYDHTNIYHYTMDFIANFTEAPLTEKYIYTEGDVGLNVTTNFTIGS